MRILAIDYGRARVGLAISDALGLTCRPLTTLPGGNRQALLESLSAICEEQEVGTLLLGMPFDMDGEAGIAAGAVREFRDALAERIGLPIVEIDERLSSKQAHAMLKTAGVKHKKRKELVDATAAWILLQTHLQR
jgi:putative Holliday junction resolvase